MKIDDFILERNPNYSRPFHLGRLCDAIDQIGTEPQRRIFWHGPRCGLTQTLMAATRLHQLSFAYAGPRRSLNEHVIAQLGGNVHPGDRINAGTPVTGAYFLDGYVPNREQWEHILTRVTPLASIFVFAEPYARDIENIRGRFIAELMEQGFGPQPCARRIVAQRHKPGKNTQTQQRQQHVFHGILQNSTMDRKRDRAAYFARFYRERAAAGLCAEGRCPDKRAPGRARCPACLDYQRKKYLTRLR